MKTDKELIELLFKEVKKEFSYITYFNKSGGICIICNNLHKDYKISYKEYDRLTSLLIRYSVKYGIVIRKDFFWWKPYRKLPRVRFLKRVLKDINYEKQTNISI